MNGNFSIASVKSVKEAIGAPVQASNRLSAASALVRTRSQPLCSLCASSSISIVMHHLLSIVTCCDCFRYMMLLTRTSKRWGCSTTGSPFMLYRGTVGWGTKRPRMRVGTGSTASSTARAHFKMQQ